jgi:sugar/nucleoside kinase (ribokinase family)
VRTSYTVILNPPGIDRIFLHHTGANDTFNSADIDLEILRQANLFHFGYPPILKQMYLAGGAELEKTLRLAKETGVTTSLDMTLPDASAESGRVDWKAILERALPYVDIFLPSLRELLFMLRREMYDHLQDQAAGQASPALLSELGSDLLRMGVKIVLIKLGERGVYVRTGGEPQLESLGRARPSRFTEWASKEYWTPGFRAKVAGTTGAGDAAIAGFLSALLRDMTLLEGLTAAAAVGACNVEAPDALSGIPAWPVVQERIQAGWPRLPLDLSGSSWEWDPAEQVWVGPNGES